MIQLFGFGFSRGKGIIDNKQYRNFERVGYASGTCLFTSLELFKNLGMFDSFLFAYHDDLDLGWRAAMNANFNSLSSSRRLCFQMESFQILSNGKKQNLLYFDTLFSYYIIKNDAGSYLG
jgi:hypothetical protein